MALGGWSLELPLSDHTGLSDLLDECPVRGHDCPMEGTNHAISHPNWRMLSLLGAVGES